MTDRWPTVVIDADAPAPAVRLPLDPAPAHPRSCPFSQESGARLDLKGLWRGVGEPPLRGLYNVLASSSIGHHQFREEASTRSARIFGPAVSTSDLPNEAVFSSRPSSAASLGQFQTIRRARREAGTRPRSPRFKWRAGTPHPPLHQPSGAESTTMNGSSRALVCETMNGRLGRQDEER